MTDPCCQKTTNPDGSVVITSTFGSHEIEDLRGKAQTYASLRAAVLKAGRFSVFEAMDTARKARLFGQLGLDLTLKIDHDAQFPWTGVRLRTPEDLAPGQVWELIPDMPEDEPYLVRVIALGRYGNGKPGVFCRNAMEVWDCIDLAAFHRDYRLQSDCETIVFEPRVVRRLGEGGV